MKTKDEILQEALLQIEEIMVSPHQDSTLRKIDNVLSALRVNKLYEDARTKDREGFDLTSFRK